MHFDSEAWFTVELYARDFLVYMQGVRCKSCASMLREGHENISDFPDELMAVELSTCITKTESTTALFKIMCKISTRTMFVNYIWIYEAIHSILNRIFSMRNIITRHEWTLFEILLRKSRLFIQHFSQYMHRSSRCVAFSQNSPTQFSQENFQRISYFVRYIEICRNSTSRFRLTDPSNLLSIRKSLSSQTSSNPYLLSSRPNRKKKIHTTVKIYTQSPSL